MSQYGLIYRMEFKNVEGFTVRVNIYPTDIVVGDSDPVVVIPLVGSGRPVIISASNNDEDKFTPIRSKSAKIQFRTDTANGLDSSTFSQGSDTLWRCDIILQDTPQYIFRGFLMMADNQQPFQPDPQFVTLTATDHLAALKEATWQDLSNVNPIGKYRVADVINFCLRKTGLELKFYVVNNLRAGGGQFTMAVTFASGSKTLTVTDTKMFYPGQQLDVTGTVSNNGGLFVKSVDSATQITVINTIISEVAPTTTLTDHYSSFHWYDKVYMDALTFEKEIGISEDCNTVLSKVFGEDCFITQWKGNWWIFRVDEMDSNAVYVAEFNSSGVYVSTAAGTQYDKDIGRNDDYKFANADTLLRFVRPHGFVKETFNFDSPLEVPCNVDFVRGALLTTVGNTKTYTLDCFTGLTVNVSSGVEAADATATNYIKRVFSIQGDETERYVVLSGGAYSAGTIFHSIKSQGIPLGNQDKFTISFDWKINYNLGTLTYSPCMFKLVGDSGTVYYWSISLAGNPFDGLEYKWVAAPPLSYVSKHVSVDQSINDYTTDWQNISVDVGPVPESGTLYIFLYNHVELLHQPDTYFANLTFEYIPFINGSYQLYSGQYNKVDRTETGYIANRDNEVLVSDSPRPLLKGGMFLSITALAQAYWLFPNWFDASKFSNSYPTTNASLHPYGYLQAFSVWNQYKGYNITLIGGQIRGKGINIFAGSVKGLTDDWPDLLHRYTLTDINPQTADRYFLLISLEQDWKSCIWTGSFIEVFNLAIGKTYADTQTFKFISQ